MPKNAKRIYALLPVTVLIIASFTTPTVLAQDTYNREYHEYITEEINDNRNLYSRSYTVRESLLSFREIVESNSALDSLCSEYLIRLTGNDLLDILLYSQNEAAQAIRSDLDLYFREWLMPDTRWISANTRDLSNYRNHNSIVIVNDFSTVVAHDMYENRFLHGFEIYTTDPLTREIVQTLVAPDTVFPTAEELMNDLNLAELPTFRVPEPLPESIVMQDIESLNTTEIESIINQLPMSGSELLFMSFAVRANQRVTDTRISPYHAIAYIDVTWANGTKTHGTGFLTHNNIVVTAGHVIYNHSRGGWATCIRVYPGRNEVGDNPFGGHYVNLKAVGLPWQANAHRDGDFGVLRLDTYTNVPSTFNLSPLTDTQLRNLDVTITGYPVGVWPSNTMWRSRCITFGAGRGRFNMTPHRFTTNAETGRVISGAPVYTVGGDVVGIQVGLLSGPMGTHNTSIRIRQDMTDWINHTFRMWNTCSDGG